MKTLSFALGTVVGLALSTAVALAWTGPTATPPGNNVAAPINVGTTNQIKNGNIGVNGLAVFGNAYVQTDLGIGVQNPTYALDVLQDIAVTDSKGSTVDAIRRDGSNDYFFPFGTGYAGHTAYFGTSANPVSIIAWGDVETAGGDLWVQSTDAVRKDGNYAYLFPFSTGYANRTLVVGAGKRTLPDGTILDGTTNLDVFGSVSATAFTQTSDERLKTDITPLDGQTSLAAINALNPVSFNWKGAGFGSQPQFGFIAQQVRSIFPNLIKVTASTTLTPDGTLTVDYDGIIPSLVKAVQEQQSQIQQQQSQIQEQQSQIQSLQAKITALKSNQ